MRGTGPAAFFNSIAHQLPLFYGAIQSAFGRGWRVLFLDDDDLLLSGGHYVALCLRVMGSLGPLWGFRGAYVPRYMARKVSADFSSKPPGRKSHAHPPLPLTRTFQPHRLPSASCLPWCRVASGAVLLSGSFVAFAQTRAGSSTFLRTTCRPTTCPESSGGVPAEEASMWYCILKSQGVVSIPDGADVGSLREEASAFEFKHGFSPNVGT